MVFRWFYLSFNQFTTSAIISPRFYNFKYYFLGSVAFKINAKKPAGINPVVSNSLNLIPKSHLKRYTFQELIRFIHNKFKNSKNNIINKLREKLAKFIGINIQNDPGDCIIFNAKTWHSPSPSKKEKMAMKMSGIEIIY